MTPRRSRRAGQSARAVIDIGSNTVRLVIYDGPPRAPEVIWNEKVVARLGRDLQASGAIPEDAAQEALRALARYKLLLDDRGIADVQTVATAASRDATNGQAFLEQVERLGLAPRLLSGEEEALAAALGVIGAFPNADGIAVDLGGGSLELVRIANGDTGQPTSLPFGTLRLPGLRSQGRFGRTFDEAFDAGGWDGDGGQPLYMIGGTWRALADFAMREAAYPLSDPHGFRLPAAAAERLAKRLSQTRPGELENAGLSPMRAAYLPDSAALLRRLIGRLAPRKLIFSSWGLREGLLFAGLSPLQRRLDPLLAGVQAFAEPRDATLIDTTRLAGWTADLAAAAPPAAERLRLAAAHLSAALQRVEPNLRARHAEEWSLDKRWIALDPAGRAVICAALYGSLGRTVWPEMLDKLASKDSLRDGVAWGLGFRLARRLGAGSQVPLTRSQLRLEDGRLTLAVDRSREKLITQPVRKELAALASWTGREPGVDIISLEPSDRSPN